MMKLCSAVWGVARSVLGLLIACLALQTQALTLELREAQAAVTVQGHTTLETVSLPYHWDRRHKGLAGTATFEVPFEPEEVPTVPYSLYIARLGNAYEIWQIGILTPCIG